MWSRKYFKISKMSLWYYEIFEDIQHDMKIHDYACSFYKFIITT